MAEKDGNGNCMVVILLFGIGFIALSVESLFGFIFGGKSFISDFLDPDSHGTNLSTLRFVFGIFVLAVVIFFLRGGKMNDFFNNDK